VPAAIFIDKDGTLVEDVPYNIDPQRVRLAERAVDGLRALRAAGFRIVVITNQSGVARGLFGEGEVRAMGSHLAELLDAEGAALDGFYYCPHHPDGHIPDYAVGCDCRKPAPGLIRRAAADLRLQLEASWMIGDIATDIEAGAAAGCRTALVNRRPDVELRQLAQQPDVVAPDLAAAAARIVALGTMP
jgi:histidinol-phosphate phosphatase family protein